MNLSKIKTTLFSLPKRILGIKKRFLIPAVIVVIILILILSRGGNQVQPQFASVGKEDLKQEVSASGILDGQNSSTLHFKSGGKLSFINVKVGYNVYQGEVLAGLDSQDESIALQQARNTLDSDQATLQKVYDDIHLSQYGNGGFSNVGSANETETQRMERINAEEAVNSAYDGVKAAQQAVDDTVITSPINGIVTQASPLPGQVVSVSDDIAQVVDFSQIVFASDVDESDVAKVQPGQKAEVTLNAYGDKIFNGTVSEILHQTRTTTNGATVVTAKVALSDPSITQIEGLNGQVNIITSEKDNVLAIPQTDLLNSNTVLVKTPQGIQEKTITTGFQNDTDIEVTSGLSEGDQIVANPVEVDQSLKSKGLFSKIFRR